MNYSLLPSSKKFRRITAAVCAMTAVISITALTALWLRSEPVAAQSDPITGDWRAEEDSLSVTQPVLLNESSSSIIIGTVLSNETANIYPRRNGIVEDIYVDIGDIVQKNQVVALLLPAGVEGQSAAAIAEKNAKKLQAEADYINSTVVAQEAIDAASQKVEEVRTALVVAESEQESILRKFAQYEANIHQMLEQSFISIRNARQLIERILIGSNTQEGDIYDHDILNQIALHDTSLRYDIVPLINGLYHSEEQFLTLRDREKRDNISVLFTQADDALLMTNTMLAATPAVPGSQPGKFSQAKLTDSVNSVLSAQNDIYKAKEKLEDAVNAYETLIAAEPDLYKSAEGQSNKVSMLTAQLQTSERNMQLVESQQQKMLVKSENMVAVADAVLGAEYARSGHREIRSPFSGVVSKRFLTVGEVAVPSMSAFELVDVLTSLSKAAKREVQFGLPEHLISAVEIGDTIMFFLSNGEGESYQAEVTRKSPQVDTQTHTITVQAKISDDLNLPHNTSVRIRLTDDSTPVFQVPSSVVKRGEDKNYLWVLDEESKPQKVFISVMAEDGEFAEVTGDITEQSQIILDPPDLLQALLTE